MIYRTQCDREFHPTRRLLVNMNYTGGVDLLLRNKVKVSYISLEVFEKSLLENKNVFFIDLTVPNFIKEGL